MTHDAYCTRRGKRARRMTGNLLTVARAEKAKRKRLGVAVRDDETVWRMCTAKTRYPSEESARAGAFHLFETRSADVFELWVYRCPNCLGWHMTKQPQEGQASITAGDIVTVPMEVQQ